MHTEWLCQNTAIFGAFRRTYRAPPSGLLRRAMRLFAQPVLDAPGVVSSTSKLCHYGSPQMAPAPAPPVEFLAPTKLWRFAFAFCRGEITAPIVIAALTQ